MILYRSTIHEILCDSVRIYNTGNTVLFCTGLQYRKYSVILYGSAIQEIQCDSGWVCVILYGSTIQEIQCDSV